MEGGSCRHEVSPSVCVCAHTHVTQECTPRSDLQITSSCALLGHLSRELAARIASRPLRKLLRTSMGGIVCVSLFCGFLRRRPQMHGCAQTVVAQNATPSSEWVPCCDPDLFRRTTWSGPSRASRKVPVHTAPAHAMPLSAAHCLRFRLMRCCHTQFDEALMQVACRKRNRPESALEQGNAIGLSQHIGTRKRNRPESARARCACRYCVGNRIERQGAGSRRDRKLYLHCEAMRRSNKCPAAGG